MNDFSLIIAKYNSSLPTLADGQYTGLQVDVNGRLLVQADVTVLVDFLGLNGAANSANILIVGTEDGTDTGTAHAVRLASDGAVMINDNGGSITVDASNLDIRDLVFATDKVDVSGSTNIGLDAATLAALESITVQNGAGASAVNIQDGGNSITVDGVDFDIRDIDASQDNIAISDGTDTLAINADGSLNITDNGGSLTVDATNLDIRDLVFATDKVDVSGSSNVAVVDGGGSLTVDAVNLDIRDLSHSQDSVKIGDGTDFLAVNTDGSINVNATVAPIGSEEYSATDALAAGGDGLVTITAAATPWVDACVFAHTSGTAYLMGYEWACDQNANARIITDDGTDLIVYKQSLNSSSQPSVGFFWGNDGRIEIPGSAGLNIKLQIKKRSATGGNGQGFGSLHIRK